jgi:hypothetical protein
MNVSIYYLNIYNYINVIISKTHPNIKAYKEHVNMDKYKDTLHTNLIILKEEIYERKKDYLILYTSHISWNLKKIYKYSIFNIKTLQYEDRTSRDINDIYNYININSIKYKKETPAELINVFKFANNAELIKHDSMSVIKELKNIEKEVEERTLLRKQKIEKEEKEYMEFQKQKILQLQEKQQELQIKTNAFQKQKDELMKQ